MCDDYANPGSVGEKTQVTLVHGGFPRAADMSDYPFGWGELPGN